MADIKEPKSYAGIIKVAIIVVIGLLLTGLVLFLTLWVFRRVVHNGVVQDYLPVVDVRAPSFDAEKSTSLTSLNTNNVTKSTYTIGVNIHNLYNSSTGKVLLGRGSGNGGMDQDFAIYIDKQYNDLLLAFNTNKEGVASIGDKYCIFRVENIPIYRWTVFHLVVDMDMRTAKIYIDGDLRKVCNLFACSSTINAHKATTFNAGRILDNSNNFQTASPSFANYGAIYVRTRAMNPDEIVNEAKLLLDRLSELQRLANKTNGGSSCPTV